MAYNVGWQQQMPQGVGQQQPWQQQPWQQQMGTRGVEGQQVQPGQFQGQMGQQQQAGFGMPQPGGIAPQEKEVLKEVLNILKEGRAALATGAVDPLVVQRLTGAHAYICGYLEAKGQQELGAYVRTIPRVSARDSAQGDPRFDEMVDNFERALSEGPETRFWGALASVAISVAPEVLKRRKAIAKIFR
ncbi:MAG TPA: hypothetical protein VLQ93_06815 [Myxococcaceae bacterium]|nr:hypothetical protein [Myxococcaceae bacterium]